MTEGTPPPLVVGRYEVHGELGAGGMATVHLGRLVGPRGFSRTVAIKRLHPDLARDPELAASFFDEARLSARIHHPNVVATLDVVATDDHQFFLVMEYVAGESLARLLRAASEAGQPIPTPVAVFVMASALRGLEAAHETLGEGGEPLGLVHRDVSPQNIMVGVDGVTRVLDFGIAKELGRAQHTEPGQLKGKLSYMAPEQLHGKPVDRRTDVFAASIVLWEVLALHRLFAGDTAGEIVTKMLNRDIPAPSTHSPSLSPELDAVVMRGLARDPDDRYPTALEMAVALEALVTPATAAQTGQWVASLAKEALALRARRVAELESRSKGQGDEPRADRSGPNPVVPAAPSSGPLPRSDGPPRAPISSQGIADAVAGRLAPYLGSNTSKVAVKTFSMKALGRGPETLTRADVLALMQALRPMLRTFVGRAQCERILERISGELGA